MYVVYSHGNENGSDKTLDYLCFENSFGIACETPCYTIHFRINHVYNVSIQKLYQLIRLVN
jgi:hypothetical protein